MKPKQRMLLQLTYTQISSKTDQVAEQLHRRLVRLDPQLRVALAGSDLKPLGRRLIHLMGLAVRPQETEDGVAESARSLGVDYAEAGLGEVHFDTVGEALLWTVEQTLEEGLSRDERLAWTRIYQQLTGWMKEGAKGAETGPAETEPSGTVLASAG